MPDWIVPLFRSGAVADIAVAVLVVETVVLIFRRRKLGLAAGPLLFNAASGIALILALRAALVSPEAPLWIGVWLTLGFVAHLGDVWWRTKTPCHSREGGNLDASTSGHHPERSPRSRG